MFAFLQSLAGPVVKHVIKLAGNSIAMGFPVGEILVECWEGHWKRKSEAELQHAIAEVAQEQREAKRQVALLIEQIAANQPESIKQQAATYLNMVPAAIQRSLRRPDDLSGRTVPPQMRIRGPADLQQFLPDRMPRFKIGDCPLAGTDLVLEKFIGIGGFGEVWKAVHQKRPNAPPVALKFCTDAAAAKSLHREVDLLDRVTANKGQLKNIVELKYAHLQADPPCLEYEYVGGGDLADLLCELHQQNRATPNLIAQIMLQLANAVGSAHDIQPPIVHRDLKPANVLVQRTGTRISLKVADFGIGNVASELALEEARHATVGTTTTQTFTPLYASPQQRIGRLADPRDDVYALGVIWHQLLIGDLRSEAPRGSAWKRRLAEQGMSANLIALLEQCVEDRAEDRPRNAVVVAKQLSEYLKIRQEPPSIESQAEAIGARQEQVVEQAVPVKVGADEALLARLCTDYVDHIKAFTYQEKVLDRYTRNYIPPDEQLMRSVEELLEIPNSRKSEFRRELMDYIGALALDGKRFDHTTCHERMRHALEKLAMQMKA